MCNVVAFSIKLPAITVNKGMLSKLVVINDSGSVPTKLLTN